MSAQQDARLMAMAIKLAEKGLYTTDPNPRVGCILAVDDKIIAEGWHYKAGYDHAEVVALKQAGDVTGGTAYATLEPCSHHGRTGPCCDALILSGVKRVVVAMQDPNPLVSGRGIEKMRAAGLVVECGVLEQEAHALNQGFIKRMTTGLPFVRSKLGMSLDGRTAMASGESQWITSPQARADVQLLRAESSAVLTGINTVLADDPSLNVRLDVTVKQPIRVILDSRLRMPVTARMAGLEGESWILTCSQDKEKIVLLESAGFHVFQIASKGQSIDLHEVLVFLGKREVNTLLVEAGAILNGALLDQNLIDECVVYMAACVLGDQGRGLFHLPNMQTMNEKKQLTLTSFRQVGSDLRLVFNPNK
jgi:diaminohydroxyphosphoribosylaminopyrimidine deaminase/5-amino-6-(5-phosphoribosylamino)uracil reductase